MDNLISQVQDAFEGPIDFEGQRIAELLCTLLLSVTAAVAFVVGYLEQDIYLTLWIGLAGSVMTVLAVVPPWPAFNQHPEHWLRSGTPGMSKADIVVAGKKVQ
ncbi:hypothetical protein GJ744_000065 [Endocarpon pusillum]|uniref:Signal peptidase complex subunit 1 n=1 Tax=Endocarpon pusillum TaxID=364733 RepID=A0A8H7B036_9EURO|nr:hypothetical protein GJ744_000065 [Endocarpon pusillum]